MRMGRSHWVLDETQTYTLNAHARTPPALVIREPDNDVFDKGPFTMTLYLMIYPALAPPMQHTILSWSHRLKAIQGKLDAQYLDHRRFI